MHQPQAVIFRPNKKDALQNFSQNACKKGVENGEIP